MKKLLALAAFLLASSTAQAQYQFEYGGHTIRIDPDRGTVSIPGVYDNSGKKSKRAKGDQDASKKQASPQTPAPATADTAPPPPAVATAPPAATQLPPPAPLQEQSATATANNAPPDNTLPPPPAPPPLPTTSALPPIQADAPPTAPLPPAPPPAAPTVAAVPAAPAPPPPAVQRPATPVAAPAATPRDPNSPVGVWLTEEKEGKVRIEQCGANLCGYSVDAKSNLNGEQVLINMKPSKDLKWSGRILDPNTGSTYDSTIALKGSDTLRVQGCAFGGMFCGGQTWTRVN
jgi:Uncharacterized protein conserved in bacteria (DUF2147)